MTFECYQCGCPFTGPVKYMSWRGEVPRRKLLFCSDACQTRYCEQECADGNGDEVTPVAAESPMKADVEKLEMALEELRMAYAERRYPVLAPSQFRLILVELERRAQR